MSRISEPFESLTKGKGFEAVVKEADYVIVGSGYGGSVAAMRLAGATCNGTKQRVLVLERGKEYELGDFPYDIADIPSHIRTGPGRGYADALFTVYGDIEIDGTRSFDKKKKGEGSQGNPSPDEDSRKNPSPVDVLVGSGLGGTSLINANVAEEPLPHVFRKRGWPRVFREAENPLQSEFAIVRQYLGVTTHKGLEGREFPKYQALKRLAKEVGGEVRPAKIAVSTEDGPNVVGVRQNACTDCGNCVTGCNVGAKNTLDRNLLPLAKSRGAELITGVTVLRLDPYDKGGYRWILRVRPTVQMKNAVEAEEYCILARNIILAAGTMGTAEILQRSNRTEKGDAPNRFSSRLGENFSTNGDGIVMSYGQSRKVHAVAGPQQKSPSRKIGPTITGITQTHGVTIEEAAIPASLGRLFSEFVTTSAMIQRLADRTLPRLFRKEKFDPLAASMEVADHCQAFLVMGDDGAKGTLKYRAEEQRLDATVPNARYTESLKTANRLIKGQDRKAGLDGGQYAPNLMWELLPPEATSVMGGAMPVSRAVTVHPLGGCCMADDVQNGVVDDHGRVFDQQHEGQVHPGLFVMDASIMPSALEVNPFLTIAALAWRASGWILNNDGLAESTTDRVGTDICDAGPVPVLRRSPYNATSFEISEQLTGEVENGDQVFGELLPDQAQRDRLKQLSGLVVEVRAKGADAESWLENPGCSPLPATMQFRVNPLSPEDVNNFRPVGVDPHHLYEAPFLALEGTFTVFEEKAYNCLSDFWGGVKALATYVLRRGLLSMFKSAVASGKQSEEASETPPIGMLKKARVFFNIGQLQSRHRTLVYAFRDEVSGIEVSGKKVLGYSNGLDRLWQALLWLELDISCRPSQSGQDTRPAIGEQLQHTRAQLRVNTDFLINPGLVQIRDLANLPQSLLFTAGFAGYFGRILFGTNFWEFAGLDYPEKRKQKTDPRPLSIGGCKKIPPEPIEILDVPIWDGDKLQGPTIPLELTRYKNEGRPPVLFLHGLAQGSQIFWTDSVKNLAAYFYRKGYDVWLLDYRISNRIFPHQFESDELMDWSMDEIAAIDIPMAINRVFENLYPGAKKADFEGREEDKLSIIAHCVGACSFAMAVLNDGVRPEEEQIHWKIRGYVGNAIHPWVLTGPTNRFRSRLGNLVGRDFVPVELLNPIPSNQDGALHNFVDRIAYSLSRVTDPRHKPAKAGMAGPLRALFGWGEDHVNCHGREGHRGLLQETESMAVCNRMTFLYGRMWNHENLAPATHKAFLDMLGPAPAGVYAHLYYYSELKRIAGKDGENRYLTRGKIQKHWTFKTLFVHGDISRVFNPHSARRSAVRMNLSLRPSNGDMKIPVHYKIIPGYGHMDPIFAKNAHRECFGLYHRFLEGEEQLPDPLEAMREQRDKQEFAKQSAPKRIFQTYSDYQPVVFEQSSVQTFQGFSDLDDWEDPFSDYPQVGPILRGVWLRDGHIVLRYWSEVRVNHVVVQNRLGVNDALEVDEGEVAASHPGSKAYRYIDLQPEISESVSFSLYGHKVEKAGTGNGATGRRLQYEDEAWLRRLRKSESDEPRMCFLVGSCRFPGTVLDDALSDRAYGAMLQHIEGAQGAELLFLTGDQIYADAMDQVLATESLPARYTERYRRAFSAVSSPKFAALVQRVPTHFALDDHEIDDNWSGLPELKDDAPFEQKKPGFAAYYARREAERYLGSGRGRKSVRHPQHPGDFHYALDNERECDFPTFVMDTRTQRRFRKLNLPAEYPMIDSEPDNKGMAWTPQLKALKEWLLDAHKSHRQAPKFIVCGSVLAPLSKSYTGEGDDWRRQDGWAGYPRTMKDVLGFIAIEDIEKVVFVGGDAHLSALSSIDISVPAPDGADKATCTQRVWQIVSSGIYAPLPFANARVNNIVWDEQTRIPVPVNDRMELVCHNYLLCDYYSQFVKVSATPGEVSIACYNRDNRLLATRSIEGDEWLWAEPVTVKH